MQSFQHIIPSLRIFQGSECLQLISKELDRLRCKRAVIICGGSILKNEVLITQVKEALGERLAGFFGEVAAHSPSNSVLKAVQVLRDSNADSVIAIGGGSAIVTARAASILLAEDKDLNSLCTQIDDQGKMNSPRLSAPKIPQFIIPTTPTTAMVKAGSAVLDSETGERKALFDPKTRAQSIFIHPDFLNSAPEKLIIGSGLNTFTMAFEGLISQAGNSLSDAQLLHSLRLSKENLSNNNLSDSQRSELVLAAILCGQGSDFTSLGLTSALGHAIGSKYHIENGIVNAIVLPHVLRFNADFIQEKLSKIATALGLFLDEKSNVLEEIIQTLERFLDQMQLPKKLSEIGVQKTDLPIIATQVLGDWFLKGNPRKVNSISEIENVLEQAL